MLRPGCRFRFYAMIHQRDDLPAAPALHDLLGGKVARVRLGKFPAKARLRLEAATSTVERAGPFVSDALLNWRDLEADSTVCDILAASLPTRLLTRAHFAEGLYYEAHFGEDVIRLPKGMRFLARPPETRGRRGKS
jgi:hypothetical protein